MSDLARGIPWGHAFLKKKFDLVFLDPPYSRDIAPTLVAEIATEESLSAMARVIVETGKINDLPVSFSGLSRVHARIYGDTKISIYELTD